MNTLTKEQIQELTPEQQETVATLEARRTQQMQELLAQARHYPGQRWMPALVMGALYLACVFATQQLVPVFVGVSLWFMIQFHAAGVNRRLDALTKLLRNES